MIISQRFYKLPVWGNAGATDSKLIDAQAGLEAAISIYSAFLSHCTLVHDVTYLEYGSTSLMEMMVIADKIISMIRYIMCGVTVEENTQALEAIGRTRPGSGFLADEHTLRNFRQHQWIPRIIDQKRGPHLGDCWLDGYISSSKQPSKGVIERTPFDTTSERNRKRDIGDTC